MKSARSRLTNTPSITARPARPAAGSSQTGGCRVRSEVTIRAKFPVTRRTPVSDLPTQEIYTLIGRALANGSKPRRMVGVEVRGLNACPCAQGLVRDQAGVRLREAGYDDGQVDEI